MTRAIFVMLGVTFASFAHAQSEPGDATPPEAIAPDTTGAETEARPWAEGVSVEASDAALALFRTGNEHYARNEFRQAVSTYREALDQWDHPAIRGNLSISLVHLDRPIEALAEVERALRFGAAPFTREVFQQLETNRRLLRGQLSEVTITNTHDDAEVALDGETVLRGAGTHVQVLRAGNHRVVATRSGHLTFTSEVVALPGEAAAVEVLLVPLERAAIYERPMAPIVPWTVLAAGVVTTAVGGVLQGVAARNLSDYNAELVETCASGCTNEQITSSLRRLERQGERRSRAAVGLFTLGAASTVAGVVLAVWNRERRVEVDADGRRLTLDVSPRGATVGLEGRF
ncbi:MAG: hypothetical protein R3B99_05340 [Polyangiales bacterium]|nr:hypothetical protein [Myxococcales bacterium]